MLVLIVLIQLKVLVYKAGGPRQNTQLDRKQEQTYSYSGTEDVDTRIKLAHVVNFYPCSAGCSELFHPLDQTQNVTFTS
jgi:hypothetical protein